MQFAWSAFAQVPDGRVMPQSHAEACRTRIWMKENGWVGLKDRLGWEVRIGTHLPLVDDPPRRFLASFNTVGDAVSGAGCISRSFDSR
jgi:hypothetical protein